MNIKIENIDALLMEEGKFRIKRCDIYIKDGKIISTGIKPQNFVAERTIDGKSRLAIPGLINTHTHSYMSVFRNVADDLDFSDWLFKRIMPMEDKLTEEDMYWGAMLGCIEMIRTGTTCFVDMNININAVVRAVTETGMRAVLSRGLVGEGNNDGGQQRLFENLDAFKNCKNDRITFLLGPHAPYTCDCDYLKIVVEEAKKNNLGLTIHLSESLDEIEGIRQKHNMTPIELMEKCGVFDVPVIAAHCVQLCDNDIEILARNNVSVATNPKSNLKLANGIAPLVKMHKGGVNVTIGTDSAASNNTLNMFSEMNYAALLHKGKNHSSTVMSAEEILTFATKNAQKAVNNPYIGEIKEGMSADITILDIDTPQFYPRNNLIAALVYSANGYETDTVIIDGQIVMENKEIKTVDVKKVYEQCEKIIKRIDG